MPSKTIVMNGDKTADWLGSEPGDHYVLVNETIALLDISNYLRVRLLVNERFYMEDVPDDVLTIHTITLRVAANVYPFNTGGTPKLTQKFYHGTTQIDQVTSTLTVNPDQTTYKVYSSVFSGLSLTQAQGNDLEWRWYPGNADWDVNDELRIAAGEMIVDYDPVVKSLFTHDAPISTVFEHDGPISDVIEFTPDGMTESKRSRLIIPERLAA